MNKKNVKKLAVLIMAYNEEKNLAACLDTVRFADEIVLVDSGSTDKTVEIAKAYGAKVVVRPMDEGGFAAQRNFLLEQTEADWVFYIDADERLQPETAREMRSIVERDDQAVWAIRRFNVVMGQKMSRGAHGPDWSDRFYPRSKIRWEGAVHEYVKAELPHKRLQGTMLHYTYDDWESYLRKLNQYTTLSAQERYAKGGQGSLAATLGHAGFAFFRSYILKLGFTEGWLGFVMSVMAAFYNLVKYLKLRNLYRKGNNKE